MFNSITRTLENYKSSNTELSGRQNLNTPAGSLAQVMKELFLIYVPTGSVFPFAGTSAPPEFLLCDGSAVSRVVYATLFAAIGTAYGIGDGSTTFNLPDLRGKVISGYDSATSFYNAMGKTGGENTHTLTIAEMPSHNHSGLTQNAGIHTHVVNDPGHSHTQTTVNDDFNNSGSYPNFNYPSYPNYDGAGSVTWTQTINSSTTGITNQNSGDHQHTINAQGGGSAFNNLQPYLVMNFIIKI